MAVDYFIRRFKSVQSFKPYKQVPKVLKYIQDLIKVIKRQTAKYQRQQQQQMTSLTPHQASIHSVTQSFPNLPLQIQSPPNVLEQQHLNTPPVGHRNISSNYNSFLMPGGAGCSTTQLSSNLSPCREQFISRKQSCNPHSAATINDP